MQLGEYARGCDPGKVIHVGATSGYFFEGTAGELLEQAPEIDKVLERLADRKIESRLVWLTRRGRKWQDDKVICNHINHYCHMLPVLKREVKDTYEREMADATAVIIQSSDTVVGGGSVPTRPGIQCNEEVLATAIIRKAAEEYARALLKHKENPTNDTAAEIRMFERWFRSSYYRLLSDLDPAYLIEKIKAYPEAVLRIDESALKPKARRDRERRRNKK